MSTIEGKNFTSFQNVNAKGSGGKAGVVRLQAVGGDGKTISFVEGEAESSYLEVGAGGLRLGTGYISMNSRNGEKTLAFVEGEAEAPYFNIASAGLRLGTGYVSLHSRNTEGTLSTSASLETARAWALPDVSGTMPIMGSFAVQLPSLAATTYTQSTIVTVSGIRLGDALAVWHNGVVTSTYDEVGITSAATSRILARAMPGNGSITLVFFNAGAASGYVQWIFSYLAMR